MYQTNMHEKIFKYIILLTYSMTVVHNTSCDTCISLHNIESVFKRYAYSLIINLITIYQLLLMNYTAYFCVLHASI